MQVGNETYFIISRFIFESAIWREDPHILKLFIWLIGNARHDKNPKKYPRVTINRGELVTSLTYIAENNEYVFCGAVRKWSKQKVSRMLQKLQNEGYIKILSDTYGTHIKICNYEHYQTPKRYIADTHGTDVEQMWNRCGTDVELNNNVKNDKNDNNVENDNKKELPLVPTSQKKLIRFDESDMKLVTLLIELMLENNPDKKSESKAQLEDWANTCRLMRERDKRTIEGIEEHIRFSQSDEFWKANVLSMSAVRRGYDKLTMRMNKSKGVNYAKEWDNSNDKRPFPVDIE